MQSLFLINFAIISFLGQEIWHDINNIWWNINNKLNQEDIVKVLEFDIQMRKTIKNFVLLNTAQGQDFTKQATKFIDKKIIDPCANEFWKACGYSALVLKVITQDYRRDFLTTAEL